MIGLYAPTEIADLDDIALLDQNVLRFNISMNQSLLMQIVNARANLNEEVEGCVLAQILFFTNEIKQVALGGVLECQVNGRFVFETRVEATNIFVIQLFLDSNLADQRFFDFAT